MKIRTEKGQGLVEYTIILLIFVLVGLLLYLVNLKAPSVAFDNAFEAGQREITASIIELGETGHPVETQYDGIPDGSFRGYPRVFEISGCESFLLPQEAKTLRAATEFPASNLIVIQMPVQAGGYINICAPEGAEVEIVMWYEK